MKPVVLLIAGLALTACDPSERARKAEDGADPRSAQPITAVDLEVELTRLAMENAGGDELWPGFDPVAIPLAVYDGERTYLFRHPAPPQEFVPVSGPEFESHVLDGRHEAIIANSVAEIGGELTATILLEGFPPDRTLVDVAAEAMHEAFHVHQATHHPGWGASAMDLFTYPTTSEELLALRRMENAALREALMAGDEADAGCWARLALELRGDRHDRMDSASVAYERRTEVQEGLARYVETRAADRPAIEVLPPEFAPTDVRNRALATGATQAALLDRFAPGWRAALAADDDQMLDTVLAAAIGPGELCALDDAAVAVAEQNARRDVATLMADRARRSAEFEGRSGWRVVVEAREGVPLRLQGFDPVNVEALDTLRTLHTRMLRLGNNTGSLEVLDAEAVTEGVGPHPIFQGVRYVTLTGLEEPEVTEADGKVTLMTPGLTLDFDDAIVTRDEDSLIVQLGAQ